MRAQKAYKNVKAESNKELIDNYQHVVDVVNAINDTFEHVVKLLNDFHTRASEVSIIVKNDDYPEKDIKLFASAVQKFDTMVNSGIDANLLFVQWAAGTKGSPPWELEQYFELPTGSLDY
jgi:hypothetical protein